MSLANKKLSQHLATEISDPTMVEIVNEMVAAWIKAQADKYVYFDDDDPCDCGDDVGENNLVEAGLENLAARVAADDYIPSHRSGECRTSDVEDEEDEEEED